MSDSVVIIAVYLLLVCV